MIRRCLDSDVDAMYTIINDAALAYRGVIPADCWHEPYMERSKLTAEIAAGVEFWGWEDKGTLVAIMGVQHVRDVALIRHAYVAPAHQGRGIGGALLRQLSGEIEKRLLVGTWAAAQCAIRFYERHGFRLVPSIEKDRLLDAYWQISPRQRDTSVVLDRVAG